MMFTKIRPQILVAILMATGFSVFGLWVGYKMEAVEIVTAIIGGLMGFLGGVSFKVLEGDG
jgi:ABC-type multidrug transport system permease subunit